MNYDCQPFGTVMNRSAALHCLTHFGELSAAQGSANPPTHQPTNPPTHIMVNITHKSSTLRKAIASATVKLGSTDTMKAVKELRVPKGNVLEAARTAGFFAVKRTSDMIPDCHPMPVEFTAIRYELMDDEIIIEVEVHTVYKTGVEVEAMHGASVVALTIYDMLKPIDKQIEIRNIGLKEKTGGKSDYSDKFRKDLRAAVVVCSDSVSAGKKEDMAGLAVSEKLKELGVTVSAYEIIPDDVDKIRDTVLTLCRASNDLVLVTGGTGLSPRDNTPEAIRPLLEREIPGMMEAARKYGQDRTPYSMLSRGVAGMNGNTLILALPGSTRGARESMNALFPAALHVFRILEGARHD
jgi:cyclic pyranopterin monophosphate synthase